VVTGNCLAHAFGWILAPCWTMPNHPLTIGRLPRGFALLIRFTPKISENDREQRISLSPIPGRIIILGVKFTNGIEVVRSQPQTAAA
jgi:hypothetical protein